MGRVEYSPVRGGLAELARSDAVGDIAGAHAEAGEQYAVSIAPEVTGEYKRGFRVRRTTVSVPGLGRVAGAVLENDAPHAHFVEERNGDHVLARTAAWLEQRQGVVR